MKFHYNEKIVFLVDKLNNYHYAKIYFWMNEKKYLLVAEGMVDGEEIKWIVLYPELKEHQEKNKILKYFEKIFAMRSMA